MYHCRPLYVVMLCLSSLVILSSIYMDNDAVAAPMHQNDNFVYLPLVMTSPLIVAGKWSGSLFQSSTTFAFELSLSQANNDLTGTSTIRVNGQYATMSLTGKVTDNKVILRELQITDTSGPPQPGSTWCIKSAELTYTNNNGVIQLEGPWNAPGCTPGSVQLSKQ